MLINVYEFESTIRYIYFFLSKVKLRFPPNFILNKKWKAHALNMNAVVQMEMDIVMYCSYVNMEHTREH